MIFEALETIVGSTAVTKNSGSDSWVCLQNFLSERTFNNILAVGSWTKLKFLFVMIKKWLFLIPERLIEFFLIQQSHHVYEYNILITASIRTFDFGFAFLHKILLDTKEAETVFADKPVLSI